MLVIHLNNGDILTTDTPFEEYKEQYEDANLSCVRVWRHRSALRDVAVSHLYDERELIDTVINKDKIVYVDVLE